MMRDRKIFYKVSACFCLLVLFSASVWAFWPFDGGKKKEEAKTKPPPAEEKKKTGSSTFSGASKSPLIRQNQFIASFAPVVKKVAPSVVSVFTIKNTRLSEKPFPFFDDPSIKRFFGPDYEGDFQTPQSHRDREIGSGVVVSTDGYILTNQHVIQDAEEIKISFADGEKNISAKIIGVDPKTDLAVLKIERANLPSVSFANSDHVQVGDIVLVIGNPFGLSQTVTMGIVSALGRDNVGVLPDGYEDFIQTDASINPGNSGGAMADAHGNVIGISTAIYSQSGGNQGIGFAVPINFARSIMEQIIKNGRVIRGYMGISIQPLSKELAEAFGIPDASGALIGEVAPDGPAAKAGLREGDVIVAFDGNNVSSPHQLRLTIAQNPPGTPIHFKIIRDGKKRDLTVVLEELEDSKPVAAALPSFKEPSSNVLDGIEVTDLDSTTRKQLEIPQTIRGALVKSVSPSSAAADIGIRSGDIIMEIDRKPTPTAKEALNISRQVKTDRVVLRIWRHSARYVVLPIRKKEK